jgi:hypothetical protein
MLMPVLVEKLPEEPPVEVDDVVGVAEVRIWPALSTV